MAGFQFSNGMVHFLDWPDPWISDRTNWDSHWELFRFPISDYLFPFRYQVAEKEGFSATDSWHIVFTWLLRIKVRSQDRRERESSLSRLVTAVVCEISDEWDSESIKYSEKPANICFYVFSSWINNSPLTNILLNINDLITHTQFRFFVTVHGVQLVT